MTNKEKFITNLHNMSGVPPDMIANDLEEILRVGAHLIRYTAFIAGVSPKGLIRYFGENPSVSQIIKELAKDTAMARIKNIQI